MGNANNGEFCKVNIKKMIFKLDRNAVREYDGLEQAVHSIKFYILTAEKRV